MGMDWDRRRFDDRRGGESYRPADRPGRSPSRGYDARDGRQRRSPPRNRSRLRADTWVPSNRGYGRPRSRSPPGYRRRSRTPPFQGRGYGPGPYARRRSPPRRFSPRRDDRPRSPPPSWRSKSPHSEGRSRDVSRGRGSPGRNRDISPGSQDVRPARRDNTGPVPIDDKTIQTRSPRIQPNPPSLRSLSPSHNAPRREPADLNKTLPYSRVRQLSPSRPSRPESGATSRRSSPTGGPERGGRTPLKSRSRSPSRSSPPHRFSASLGTTPYQDRGSTHGSESNDSGRAFGNTDRPEHDAVEPIQHRFGANPPTQPRSLGMRQSPPTGPSQGPKKMPSQPRGSQNHPFLAAPTRPRRGPSSRDGPWAGGNMPRRGPPPAASQGPPSGPRASFSAPYSGGPNFRHPGSRQSSTVPTSPSLSIPKAPNHLSGLCAVIPGGRVLPSVLDGVAEKRLSQLEADQEKLVEQMAEIQRLKRAGLRDWDRLDHESSICALKSELAEGHLQRMADETIGGGIPF